MRVSKAQQAKNRERVVAAAARLLRERGMEGIGVDALAAAAGLTHGAVYSHFKSKEDLAAEAVRRSLAEIRARWIADAGGEGSPGLFNRLVRSYLSQSHRDNPGTGCALAAMGSDAARHSKKILRSFSDSAVALLATVAAARRDGSSGVADEDAQDDAIVAVATMLGAIVLSRAVEDRALSDRILLAARRRLLQPE